MQTFKRTRAMIVHSLGRHLAAVTAAMLASLAGAQADEALAAFEREDYAKAAALYRPRADAGSAEAQYRLGLMLRFGWGVDKDASAAASMLSRAAEQNHPLAQAELGTMYRLGRGVPENPHEAARLLRAAAGAGVGIAQLSIGRMYRDGIGVTKDPVEAYAWFQLAGENSVMDGFALRSELAQTMNEQQVAAARKLAADRAQSIRQEARK
jgi:uncharacterized protein